MTPKMTSAQVVETLVTNNSSFQNYTHPDDYTIRTTQYEKSKARNSYCYGLAFSHGLVLHTGLTSLLFSTLDRIFQEN